MFFLGFSPPFSAGEVPSAPTERIALAAQPAFGKAG